MDETLPVTKDDIEPTSIHIPIFMNMIHFKLFSGQLTLFNWKKHCILLWLIQSMFFISCATMLKPEWNTLIYTTIVLALLVPLVGYAAVLLNMFNGGWGRRIQILVSCPCHVYAWYNTLRWTISSSVDPFLSYVLLKYTNVI